MTTPETVAVVTSIVAGLAAVVAVFLSWHGNSKAQEANEISRDANRLAERALTMQEDESRVRLIVEPRMMIPIGEGEDKRPRPIVKVLNLSKFPVTIIGIHWKMTEGAGYWKNPTIANPYRELPARLEPRAALTAVGLPETFKTPKDLLAVQSCIAYTDCGEQAQGMTDQWKEHCAKLDADARAEREAKAHASRP